MISLLSKVCGWKLGILLSLHQISPMHLAAEGGRIKMVEYLAEEKADINIQDDKGVILCDFTHQC